MQVSKIVNLNFPKIQFCEVTLNVKNIPRLNLNFQVNKMYLLSF